MKYLIEQIPNPMTNNLYMPMVYGFLYPSLGGPSVFPSSISIHMFSMVWAYQVAYIHPMAMI